MRRPLRPLLLRRDNDEDPVSDVIYLHGKVFDTTGSSPPTLELYEDEPVDEDSEPILVYDGDVGDGQYLPDEETGGSRATWAIPREDLAAVQESWWHRAWLETAQGKRKDFSSGPCRVEN